MMKAIETRYAGRLFRSRLEARWAVAFNSLGWQWDYEPGGDSCGRRNYDQGARDVLLLGRLDPESVPCLLHMHKGDLDASPLTNLEVPRTACASIRTFGSDTGEVNLREFQRALNGYGPIGHPMSPADKQRWRKAMRAGLAARFEHDEREAC